MSDGRGNPVIVKHGVATRFGAGRNCPLAAQRRASPPWSIRRHVRRIAAVQFDVVALDGYSIDRAALQQALVGSRKRLTIAEALAIQLWVMALSGNLVAMKRLVRMVDGPLR